MNTRKKVTKRMKYDTDVKESSKPKKTIDDERKSRNRDFNKEFARRMEILQTWSEYWTHYTTREGDAYPQHIARGIMAEKGHIACPITTCNKIFISLAGLRYHYARCNIDKSFKCLVCMPPIELSTRGELLRHMIIDHIDDLPRLDPERKALADEYILGETRYDKNKRPLKLSVGTELVPTVLRTISSFEDLNTRVYNSENFIERPFKDWQSLARDWEIVTHEMERRRYYPAEMESVNFRVNNQNSWSKLMTGDCTILGKDQRDVPTSSVFFTGGPITSSAWLPKPIPTKSTSISAEIMAIAVNCCPMDRSHRYDETKDGTNCIQFWTLGDKHNGYDASTLKCSLSYMIGHGYGTIFDMAWCPLGTSWQTPVDLRQAQSRLGLLALACGDGQIRIISVPHTKSLLARAPNRVSESIIESVPIFKAKPVACLCPPGVGPSLGSSSTACKTIKWNLEDNQRLIVAGYANGNVALFDLANGSPILYTNFDGRHRYHPLKSWVAHGAPVTGVAVSASSSDRVLVATGSIDRQLKVYNPFDLKSCIVTEKAPITGLIWDYRLRGLAYATETAFTSFNNRVSYRYPAAEGYHHMTISLHRSTVWGLNNSIVTNSVATSDQAGEVQVSPQMLSRSSHKREKNILSSRSLYSLVPKPLVPGQDKPVIQAGKDTIFDDLTAAIKIEPDTEAEVAEEEEDEYPSLSEADFSTVERQVANKPTKFLLPLEHRAVETYADFKTNFGLEFVHYKQTASEPKKLPEAVSRAGDIKNMYCDRNCDYPFSTINIVDWSPNIKTFPYLLSATRMGICRLDRVQIVEQVYRSHIDAVLNKSRQRGSLGDQASSVGVEQND